jgi:XTP/dITP diphosphohydrolase
MSVGSARRVVLATHNQGKAAEFARLFAPHGVEILSAGSLGLPEPEETGTTFDANATLKARAAAEAAQLPALADDSGLAIAALGGAPGVHSARWAGAGRDFAVAFARIMDELGTKAEGAAAAFVCVLAYVLPGADEVLTARGEVDGHLTFPPRGSNGFGYDPVFVPTSETRTFAEMTPAEKAQYSHRSRAWEDLAPRLFGGP